MCGVVLATKFYVVAQESWGNQFLRAFFLATPKCGSAICVCEPGRLNLLRRKAMPSNLNFTSFSAVTLNHYRKELLFATSLVVSVELYAPEKSG